MIKEQVPVEDPQISSQPNTPTAVDIFRSEHGSLRAQNLICMPDQEQPVQDIAYGAEGIQE